MIYILYFFGAVVNLWAVMTLILIVVIYASPIVRLGGAKPTWTVYSFLPFILSGIFWWIIL